MTTQKDRIESAIRHIQTSADIDPWAMELAVEALKAQEACGDAVSRQTLQKELALYPIDDITSEDEAGYNRAINDVQKMVLHLPSANLKSEERTAESAQNVPKEDLISRKSAIDAVKGLPTWWADAGGYYGGAQPPMTALLDPEDTVAAIDNLPSAQPEIIRCRDCKYWREHKYAKETKRYIPFCGFNAIYTKADDFCSRAERRTDE